MSYFGNNNPKSAMGELETIENTPVVQVAAQYGILNNIFQLTDDAGNGTITSQNTMFIGNTSSAPDGLANISTREHVYARAGQGALLAMDCAFGTPQPNSQQAAGFLNSEDVIAFGYIGEAFGIIHGYNGVNEELALTVNTAGTGTATVTVDGIGYPVTLTTGSTAHNAFEIADQLSGTVPNYLITSVQSKVVFLSQFPSPRGVFSFTGSTASVTFIRINAGQEPTIDFIPQSQFNADKINWINPQKINNYKIAFNGNINFYVQDSETSEHTLVHTIRHVNYNDMPHSTSLSFRGGWLVRNLGNTIPIEIKGSKVGLFIQGKDLPPAFVRGESNTGDFTNIEQTLLIFRNRFEFNGRINRNNIVARTLSMSTESTRGMIFKIYVFPVFNDEVIYDYIDENNSIMEISKDKVGILGAAQVVGTFQASSGSSTVINLENLKFSPDTILAITATNTRNQLESATISVTWSEDL